MDLRDRLLHGLDEHPWRALVVFALAVSPLYELAARAPLYAPRVIAPWAWDARAPLVSVAVVPYLSYFLLLPALLWSGRRNEAFPRVLAAAMACGLANAGLYLLFPTQLAFRPAAPEGTLLALLQRLDTPRCAMPSGHVSLPMAIAVAAWLAGREPWTAAVSATWSDRRRVPPPGAGEGWEREEARRRVAPDSSGPPLDLPPDPTLPRPGGRGPGGSPSLERSAPHARAWRWMASVYLAWTLLIAAGAWLTGQHYLIDLVTGIAFGAAMALAVNALLGAAVTLGTSEATERAPAGEPLAPASSPARPRRRIERPLLHPASALALGLEWLFILGAAAAALLWWSAPVALAAGLVIATRQHALLVLYHDAVHGLIARRRRLNDFVINTAVGVPLLLPVHLYRALHISHHRLLGTARDPERVLLYRGQRWSYRPLPMGSLALQLLGDLLGWNAVVLAWRYFAERRRGGGLRLPRTRAYPELAAQYALFAALWIAAAVLWPAVALRVAALWFLPYLTLTQLLQKVRSFAEHTDDADRHARSCSWAPGLLGRLTIWPYNINYHREHHARPDVPWNRLPAAFPAARQRPGAALRAHLWSGASR